MHNLKLISLRNGGDLATECVWIEAEEDIDDLGHYMLADSTYDDDDNVSDKLRHTYWFLDKPIEKGDLIKVSTRRGKYRIAANKRGTNTHHFFWGLKQTVWNEDGDCAVLFKVESWVSMNSEGI